MSDCHDEILVIDVVVNLQDVFVNLAVVTNIWEILQVVQLTKFDYRLANNLDDELQKLRCRVNYHALRFTKRIQELGQRIVMRMQKMAHHFIAVHLRLVSFFGFHNFLQCSEI